MASRSGGGGHIFHLIENFIGFQTLETDTAGVRQPLIGMSVYFNIESGSLQSLLKTVPHLFHMLIMFIKILID
jgi:hypothetical protein